MVPTALVAVITYVPLVTLCVSFLLRAHLQRAGDGAGLGVEVQRLGERRGDGEGIRGAAAVVRLLHDERHVHLGREHVVAQPGGSLARLEGLAVETVVETRPRVDSGGKVFLHLEARDDDAGGRCARREVGERIETVRENVIPETGGNTTSVGNFGYNEAIPIRLLL